MYNKLCMFFVVIIMIFLYVKLSLKTKNDVQILQGNLTKITDNTLYEKYPIIINDRVIDSKELLNTLFKYQYSFVQYFEFEKETELKNTHKYLILHNILEEDVHIVIKSPTNKHPPIDINLPSHNVIVLPYKWTVISNLSLHGILLNDFVHRFFH